MRVADFGWNLFGESYKTLRTDTGFIDEICTFFQENRVLMHLDISNNQFTDPQAERIAHALRKNNTIYGFHFTGNKGYVDTESYLVVDDKSFQDTYSPHLLKGIEGVNKREWNM